jgi:vacuolar-type H+-ATPase subunit E/Vma4
MKKTKTQITISNLEREISTLKLKVEKYLEIIAEKEQILKSHRDSYKRYLRQVSAKESKDEFLKEIQSMDLSENDTSIYSFFQNLREKYSIQV